MLGHVLHDDSNEDTEARPCMHPIVLLARFWPVIFTRPITHMHTLNRFNNHTYLPFFFRVTAKELVFCFERYGTSRSKLLG
jgi:hypothetical protein